MAKRKPTLTLREMEKLLGYEVDSVTHSDETMKRFYSDLRPVPSGIYERTKREYEKFVEMKYRKGHEIGTDKILPELGRSKTVRRGDSAITFRQTSPVGLHRFAVDIYYGFKFNFPLLFTEDEAYRTMSVAELKPGTTLNVIPAFFNLPRELRDKIYTFALPRGKWSITNIDDFDQDIFPRGIGDPSGFYFPLSKDLVVLRVNRQMRQEALPLAYRRTIFQLDDMDDLTKLLVAVGQTGRDNIESLQFPWESRTDSECKWDKFPDSEDNYLKLPSLHVTECIRLLKQCDRLKILRLYFDSELMLNVSPGDFRTDPGIKALCSIRGIRRVEIRGLGDESLEQCHLANWLKETIGATKEKSERDE